MNAAIAWGSWATWSPQTIDAKKLNRVVLYQASYIVFCNVWRDKFNRASAQATIWNANILLLLWQRQLAHGQYCQTTVPLTGTPTGKGWAGPDSSCETLQKQNENKMKTRRKTSKDIMVRFSVGALALRCGTCNRHWSDKRWSQPHEQW